jgi:hypothetical protein
VKPIRELRFGPPKVGKTKNICETYPTPLLVINTENGGLDSVHSRPIVVKKADEVEAFLMIEKDKQPPITEVDFIYEQGRRISLDGAQTYAGDTYISIGRLINKLLDYKGSFPFNTVVLDSLSGLVASAVGATGYFNPKAMVSALQWAGIAGAKIQEVVCILYTLPCHVVVTAHAQTDAEDEDKRKEAQTVPMMPSQIRSKIGAIPSVYCYAYTEMGGSGKLEYKVRTTPQGLIKNLGQRYDDSVPGVCGPTFNDLYGKVK